MLVIFGDQLLHSVLAGNFSESVVTAVIAFEFLYPNNSLAICSGPVLVGTATPSIVFVKLLPVRLDDQSYHLEEISFNTTTHTKT